MLYNKYYINISKALSIALDIYLEGVFLNVLFLSIVHKLYNIPGMMYFYLICQLFILKRNKQYWLSHLVCFNF